MAKHKHLVEAGKAKKDEFYTQLVDIENELRHYKKHFKDKTVFCNCDDPFESNFFKYFVLNFNRLGLKKLIATCYAGSPIAGQQLSLFDVVGGDEENKKKPYKAIVSKVYDKTGDGAIDMFDVAELFKTGENELTELEGDGDFRSEECLDLLKESDIVVTNPPFSLFRSYVSKLIEYEKKFLIIGNVNAIAYKEFFPLIKDNKVWVGYKFNGKPMEFIVPDDYPLSGSVNGYTDDGKKYVGVGGTCWYTNLDIKKLHEEMILVKRYDAETYPKYDNYEAINVNKTADIPCDYDGVMGVPITFIDKYSPDQFEIIGCADANVLPEDWKGASKQIVKDYYDQGNKGSISEGWRNPIYYDANNKVKAPFKRILIRNRHPEKREG